eukprot:PhF_6_TR37609/c0_g1_i1/m.55876
MLAMDFRDPYRAVMLPENYNHAHWLWTFGTPRLQEDDMAEHKENQKHVTAENSKSVSKWGERRKGAFVSGVPEGIEFLNECRKRLALRSNESTQSYAIEK